MHKEDEDSLSVTAINTIKKYKNQCLNWLSPMAVVTIALPRPVVTLTLIPPVMLHTMMYHSMLFFPYLSWMVSERRGRNFTGSHVPRSEVEDDDKSRRYENAAVHQEPGGQEQLLELDDLAY